ncbi:hypothetical protein FHR21_002767 [Sphingopyxis panaciterrulae]|uniref:Uncharacterized protein n=1 Tax=Sphingopyxis panaciterrulae TaxID=462372 RepID=A0A7W9ESX9_9SPHN|nr:hypothetical protein [Sphingopyxis panaciterrulae]
MTLLSVWATKVCHNRGGSPPPLWRKEADRARRGTIERIGSEAGAPAFALRDVEQSEALKEGHGAGVLADLAKERVEVQLVSLSCVDFDERSAVDQLIKGFFVDTDGKKGLSG